jgi:hypothetical protein
MSFAFDLQALAARREAETARERQAAERNLHERERKVGRIQGNPGLCYIFIKIRHRQSCNERHTWLLLTNSVDFPQKKKNNV